ncbi:MAG: polyprenyl synthetase family protein [Myxococcota bacterium]
MFATPPPIETLMLEFEDTLDAYLPGADLEPRDLHAAMRHAVIGGGKRLRPRLLLSTLLATHDRAPDEDTLDLAMRAAVAVEMIHAASLVHDDLPCFDDAALRRGQPTVHQAFGEPMAVLAGDALITLAFQVLAEYGGPHASAALRLVALLSEATGSARGIIGGQSLELAPGPAEYDADFVREYHQAKTAALFRFATRAGAVVSGISREHEERWGRVGTNLGLCLQLLDDLIDVHGCDADSGKTTGRDLALGRPNGVLVEGSATVLHRLEQLVDASVDLVEALSIDPEPVRALLDRFEAMRRQAHQSAANDSPLPTIPKARRQTDPHRVALLPRPAAG